jgi:hypothetical protein
MVPVHNSQKVSKTPDCRQLVMHFCIMCCITFRFPYRIPKIKKKNYYMQFTFSPEFSKFLYKSSWCSYRIIITNALSLIFS